MDKTTIDAMRTVVDLIGGTIKSADSYGRGNVNTLDGVVLVSTLRAAVDGLRTLVDEAAAKAKAKAERAERGTAGRGEGAKLLGDLLYALNRTTREAEKNGDEHVHFKAANYTYSMYAHNARAACLAIKAMLATPPVTPAEPVEPTLEEYLAAVNRARHRGYGDWDFRVHTGNLIHSLNRDELIGVGRLLIERERAEAEPVEPAEPTLEGYLAAYIARGLERDAKGGG